MQESPSLSDMAENLITDNTPEGLRIQLVDQENISMFASGGTELQESPTKILEKVADIIRQMPN
jgi:chemotaxis protein MotB